MGVPGAGSGIAAGVLGTDDSAAAGPEVRSVVSPLGPWTITMLPHFGQARICPIAELSRTRSRAWQVVHEIENGSTEGVPHGKDRQASYPHAAGSSRHPPRPDRDSQLYHSIQFCRNTQAPSAGRDRNIVG